MYEGYDVAQICLNGHVVNSTFQQLPKHSSPFCGQCGAATITQCPSCKADIRGHLRGVMGFFRPASYCLNCGKPYPWTESKLRAARELAGELENLTVEEKEALAKSIDDIVFDSPRAALGATRFRKIMIKVGKEGASALKTMLVDIVSEAAKKTIWPG